MSLTDEHRVEIEECILDLHFTSQKYIDTGKDIHRKLLEINVQEAIELLESLADELKDDDKLYDYKMHMLMPFHIYELLQIRTDESNPFKESK